MNEQPTDPLTGGAAADQNTTEELNFLEHSTLHASDAAARLGMSTDALMGSGDTSTTSASATMNHPMAASTPAMPMGGTPPSQQQPGLNRQGSLFERIQAAQMAQGMPGAGVTPQQQPSAATMTASGMTEAPPFATNTVPSAAPVSAPAPASNFGTTSTASLGQSQDGGAVILEGQTNVTVPDYSNQNNDDGPTLYASGPSIPQYNPGMPSGAYGGDGYGGGGGGLPSGASAGEKVAAMAGMAWEGMMKLGSKAARTGYRAVSGGEGGQAGLLGGGGSTPPGADVEQGAGFGGAAAAGYAPPGAGDSRGMGSTMQGIAGGGQGVPSGEGYSMIAYGRHFVADVCGLIAQAPAPVQYALILMVCYIFWRILV